jgi:hypothetical protein
MASSPDTEQKQSRKSMPFVNIFWIVLYIVMFFTWVSITLATWYYVDSISTVGWVALIMSVVLFVPLVIFQIILKKKGW